MRKWIVAGLVVAGVLAGCTPDSPAPEPPRQLDGAGLRLPLDDYLLAPDELGELGAARTVLISRCMAAAGLAYPARAAPEPLLRSWNERRYGVTDPELAAVHGYRPGAGDPAARPPRPELDAAQRAALDGPQGCAARAAQEQLRGGPGVDRDLPRRLGAESFARSRRDPAVLAATRAWSECMRANGLSYADPLAPAADPRFAAANPPTPAELATATADVACKQRTNLVGVWSTAESAIQRDLVAANHEALQQVRQANEAELALSRQLANP